VKVAPDGGISTVSYTTLIADAPTFCHTAFGRRELPWPPILMRQRQRWRASRNGRRLNIAPAVALMELSIRSPWPITLRRTAYAYVVALNADLTLKWAASMRDRLSDGCGVVLPIAAQAGAATEPPLMASTRQRTKRRRAASFDQSSSTPVIAPEAACCTGAYTRYNYDRGHLFQFSTQGEFLGSYDFGWDPRRRCTRMTEHSR